MLAVAIAWSNEDAKDVKIQFFRLPQITGEGRLLAGGYCRDEQSWTYEVSRAHERMC
jgi:hypothetical protein